MNLLNEVEGLVATRERLVIDMQTTLEKLKDTSIPLNKRWDAYTRLVEKNILTANESYGDGYLRELDDDLTQYDNFHNDRGNTVRFIDMYERIWNYPNDDDFGQARANADAWREKVLASGYASFTYDW